VKAVITAGGRVGGEYAALAGTSVKALASVRGVTMLDRIIGALREVGATQIAVVGGDEVRTACASRVERFIDEAESGGANLLRALRAWPGDGAPLLYATSDLPYVTSEAIGGFLRRVPEGALALPLAEIGDFAGRFPAAPAFGITLCGERVVNGGVFSLPAESIEPLAGLATRFFDARKKPWRMASLVSPMVLFRYLTGRLRIAELEGLASRVLGVPAFAVRGCAAELAFDADTPNDYRYACAHA
jgi:GTP:adenosylcobinamide-phosphate guanylyltransferase